MASSFKPVGDFYSTGQDAWTCEDCAQEWYACECEPDLCPVCHTDASDICACDDVALVAVERISPTQVIV